MIPPIRITREASPIAMSLLGYIDGRAARPPAKRLDDRYMAGYEDGQRVRQKTHPQEIRKVE